MEISDFSIHLRNGAGNGNPRDGLCLMQAVHWFSGASVVGDRPECASPALCAIGIRLNDWAPSQEHRDRLWPLVWQLLDSRDPDSEQARAEHIVREVTHRVVAPLFDRRHPQIAAGLRAARSMKEIEQEAARAAEAAWASRAEAARAAAAAAWAARAEAAAWEELRSIFVEAINLGKHGTVDPVYAPRAR